MNLREKNPRVRIVVHHDRGRPTWGVTSPDLPNVFAVGDSRADALFRFLRSSKFYLEFLDEEAGRKPIARKIELRELMKTPKRSAQAHKPFADRRRRPRR